MLEDDLEKFKILGIPEDLLKGQKTYSCMEEYNQQWKNILKILKLPEYLFKGKYYK